MRYLRFFLVFLLLLILPSDSFSFQGISKKQILDNGMTVLATEMPTSPVVSVYALVKTGSATEGKFLGTGISHFVEHMLFKGTHGRGVGEIAAQIQAVGGTINASTSFDYTIYTITVPVESFDLALKIQADMLMNATMSAEEVEKEREVIFGEVRLYKDNPDRKLSEWTFQNVYLQHPYQHPIIGYEDLLKKVSRNDLYEYYKSKYAPNNIVFSVAGNIDAEQVFEKVKEAFKDFERQREIMRILPQEPEQITSRRFDGSYPTDLARVAICFSGVSILDPDLYALDLLSKILGDGESSRLYRNIYKKKALVYSIGSGNFTPIDRGVFEIDAVLEAGNVDKLLEAVMTEIEQIQKRGVDASELAKVKRQIVSELILGRQTSSEVAYMQAFDEAYAGDPHFSNKYVEEIKKVTIEDIKRVAQEYLKPQRRTMVSLVPEKTGAELTKKSEEQQLQSIQKHVLDNGLTVLLREDHTFPLISLRLNSNGGLRQEPEGLNGLSTLMSSLWTKGTRAYSAEKIAELTESRGIQLGAHSGKNSFGIGMEFLSEDWRLAIDLFKDLIHNPAFPAAEIPQIKDAMRAAIRSLDDSISIKTSIAFNKSLFTKHPFRWEEGGSLESVERMTREDVVGLYQQLLSPSNMVLTVFGDINAAEVLEEIKRKFSALPRRNVDLNWYAEPVIEAPREQVQSMDKEQAMVIIGFHGPSFKNEDRYAVEILADILGSSFSGRLFNTVREKFGQAYTLGGGYVPSLDTGVISFYVLTTPDNVDAVKDLVMKEILKLRSELVSEKELTDIKMYLKGSFKEANQTSAAMSFTAGLDELYGLGYDNYLRYDQEIDKVSADDVRRVALKYFDAQKSVTVVTRPIPDENKK